MGATIGIASGLVRKLARELAAAAYLASSESGQFDYAFALTTKGRLAADLVRATNRAN